MFPLFLDPVARTKQQYLTSTFKGLITFMIQVYAVLGKGMEYGIGKVKRKNDVVAECKRRKKGGRFNGTAEKETIKPWR